MQHIQRRSHSHPVNLVYQRSFAPRVDPRTGVQVLGLPDSMSMCEHSVESRREGVEVIETSMSNNETKDESI